MIKKLLVLSFSLYSFVLAGEYWNIDPGGTTMKFLSMHVSPRNAAMSGAGVANTARISEYSRNPLAMSAAKNPEFGINQIYMDGASLDKFTSAYFAHPIGNSFVSAGTIDFLGYDELEGRDENGLKTADYSAYAWSVQAGIGTQNEIFNWAFSARFASQTIDDETALAILGNIGASFKINPYFAFATILTNAGYVTEYDDVKEYVPMALQAGITSIIPFMQKWELHISLDAYRRADTEPQWLFGGELSFANALMIRAGYALRTQNDTENGISCGLGFNFGMIIFDYGYEVRPAFEGGNHYIALGLQF